MLVHSNCKAYMPGMLLTYRLIKAVDAPTLVKAGMHPRPRTPCAPLRQVHSWPGLH